MIERDVVFRGGVAKLKRPRGKRPSDLADLECSINVINNNNKVNLLELSNEELQRKIDLLDQLREDKLIEKLDQFNYKEEKRA